jgi:hypothetical protein
MMSDNYRLMIYFAHSTMVIYEKTIESNSNMTIGEFRGKNKDVVKRVFDEGLSIFNYELSWNQIDAAIAVYLKAKHNPQSVYEQPVYELKND